MYISPIGAKNYILEDIKHFENKEVEIKFQNYVHPFYEQLFKPFIPYASILDLIFNEGDKARDIMISGRKNLLTLKK